MEDDPKHRGKIITPTSKLCETSLCNSSLNVFKLPLPKHPRAVAVFGKKLGEKNQKNLNLQKNVEEETSLSRTKNSFEQLQNELEKLGLVVSFVVSFNIKTAETIEK